MCLYFVGERTQKSDREKREWPIYRLYLDLVMKQLYYINCLSAWATNYATDYANYATNYGTVSLHTNDEAKNSSGLQFKTQHQKKHAFCLVQTGLI